MMLLKAKELFLLIQYMNPKFRPLSQDCKICWIWHEYLFIHGFLPSVISCFKNNPFSAPFWQLHVVLQKWIKLCWSQVDVQIFYWLQQGLHKNWVSESCTGYCECSKCFFRSRQTESLTNSRQLSPQYVILILNLLQMLQELSSEAGCSKAQM